MYVGTSMIKLIDVTYYSNLEYNQPLQVIHAQKAALGFVSYIKDLLNIEVIKHSDFTDSAVIDGTRFTFFKKNNQFWRIPFKTHNYIKKQHPDVVLVQGLIFPLQILLLRIYLGKKCKIIVQHHGEKPFKSVKRGLQRIADRYIDAYIFTSKGNARRWLDKKIISSPAKVFEVLEASTFFEKSDKQTAGRELGITGNFNFLWVGRLNGNKDPLTVLIAFQNYLRINNAARLFMIYQEDDLLNSVKRFLEQSHDLKNAVTLVGKVDHSKLETWYNMADYYISASYSEGSGYALLEAMACGCVPVVTDIPSFRTITENGKYGFLYKPGNAEDLAISLNKLNEINYNEFSDNVQSQFLKELSFKSIAGKLASLCIKITSADS